MNIRRVRGLVPGTDYQMFTMSLPRRFRALYDRILLPLSSFVVRCRLVQYYLPTKFQDTRTRTYTA